MTSKGVRLFYCFADVQSVSRDGNRNHHVKNQPSPSRRLGLRMAMR